MWLWRLVGFNFRASTGLGKQTLGSVQFSSVAQSCLTLCDPMDSSTPGLPVHHQLLELAHICPLSWWRHPTNLSSVIPFSSCLQSFPASGSFLMSRLFASGGQSIEAWASAWVLPMNIQGWFHLGLIGLISLLSKRLSRIFSSFIIWTPQFFSLLYDPTISSSLTFFSTCL